MPRRAEKRKQRRGRPEASFSARSQILLGAAQAFGDRGYARCSVEDVLRAADVSRRTFYRFFKSKEELFEQLYEAASMLFLQSMRSAIDLAKTPEERLEYCIDLYLRTPQNVGPVFQVMMAESMQPGSKLYARREAVINALIDILEQNVDEVRGRAVDPLILRGIVAAQERIALHVFNEHPGDEAMLQRAKRAMMDIARRVLHDPTDEAAGD